MLSIARRTKIALIAIAASMALNVSAARTHAAGAEEIAVHYIPLHIVVDGEVFQPAQAQKGFIFNNSTYVPLRFASYAFGQAVQWNAESSTVEIQPPSEQERTSIQSYMAKHKVKLGDLNVGGKAQSSKVKAAVTSVNYVFQTNRLNDRSGVIIDNTLYVPIRFFADSIGYQVDWDAATFSISAVVQSALKPVAGGSEEAAQTPSSSETQQLNGNSAPPPAAQPSGQTGTGGGKDTKDEEEGDLPEGDGTEQQPSEGTNGDTLQPGGTQQPGETQQPGTQQPGTQQPGTQQPGTQQPGTQQPGTQQPGTQQPTTPTTPKVAYNTIVASANVSISKLKSSCVNRLTVAYMSYLAAKTDAERGAPISNGFAIVSQCDSSFESIMSDLSQKLTANGYSTDIVSTYRQQYQAEKDAAMGSLLD